MRRPGYNLYQVDASSWPPKMVVARVVSKHHHWYGVLVDNEYRELLPGRVWHGDKERAWDAAWQAIEQQIQGAGIMVQTIEQTSKVWKLAKLVGTLVLIAAVAVLGACMIAGVTLPALQGVLFVAIIAGMAFFVIGRVGAWWSNG